MNFSKIKRYFILLTLAGFLFSLLHFYYNTFLLPSFLLKEVATKPVDVIIVPGVQYNGLNWNIVMKWRMYWSVYLYKRGITKNIIYSGSAVYSPYSEAIIMALYAEKMGVAKEHIFLETKAEHTTENLYYGYQLAKEKGFSSIAFATDPFQSNMITPYVTKFNLDVSLVPMAIPLLSKIEMQDFEIESAKAYLLNFISIEARETPEEREFYSKGGRISAVNE